MKKISPLPEGKVRLFFMQETTFDMELEKWVEILLVKDGEMITEAKSGN